MAGLRNGGDGRGPEHGEAKLIAAGQGKLVVSCYMLCWQESRDENQ